MSISWVYLIASVLCEVTGTTYMKISQGFTKPLPSFLMCFFYILCFIFLNLSLKRIEVSVAYAVWSGLGTALITSIGIGWFNESASFIKLASIALILAGVLGLKSGK